MKAKSLQPAKKSCFCVFTAFRSLLPFGLRNHNFGLFFLSLWFMWASPGLVFGNGTATIINYSPELGGSAKPT